LKTLAAAQQTPSLAEPKLSLSVSNPEIHVAVDRRRAADLGVRMSTIGNTLRLAVSGDDQISFYKEGQEQYPVKVRVLENQRRDAKEIGRLTVPSPTGPVRIDNIARIEAGLGPSALQRSNRQFTVMLNASVAPGHALDEASNDIRRIMGSLNLPPTMSFRLQGQSKILDETTTNLVLAIGLAMISATWCRGAFELPAADRHHAGAADLGAVRAFTLWVTHRTLNLWSALGMLLLLGIVRRTDPAGGLRQHAARRRMPLREAIVQACRTRLRPILMTTLRDHRRPHPTSLGSASAARPRGDRHHRHRRTVALFVPDAAAGAGACEVRCPEQTSINRVRQRAGELKPPPAHAGFGGSL
jgi:HAE1 family hydrophobic/amphiphilic exporter-1